MGYYKWLVISLLEGCLRDCILDNVASIKRPCMRTLDLHYIHVLKKLRSLRSMIFHFGEYIS